MNHENRTQALRCQNALLLATREWEEWIGSASAETRVHLAMRCYASLTVAREALLELCQIDGAHAGHGAAELARLVCVMNGQAPDSDPLWEQAQAVAMAKATGNLQRPGEAGHDAPF